MIVTLEATSNIKVPMGGIGYGKSPTVLETLLGSCVGVVIWCSKTKRVGLAHVVLANSHGQTGYPGKYADTAISAIRDELLRQGCFATSLVAKLAGGSTMFGDRNHSDVGQANINAVKAELSKYQIPVQSEDLGGNQGRVIKFLSLETQLEVYVGRRLVKTI
jgi:chemotaxis protein CheD